MAITRSTILPLEHGYFTIAYHRFEEETCVSISYGNLSEGVPIVRIHSSCLFGEAFHALDCDCASQLNSTLKLIKDLRKGVVIYQYAEGRGIGLEEKIHALEIQRLMKIDTVEAFRRIGFNPDMRSYETSLAALKDLKVAYTIKFASAETVASHKNEVAQQPKANYGLPVRLRIPKIGVDAAIEHIGLTSEGAMQEPAKLQNVGWYKFGSRPGNKGSSVIAGHYGLGGKDMAVFNKLHTLSKGDVVHVEDEKRTIATFVVRELKTYDRNAVAPEVFNSSGEKAHLNLITCKGTWEEAEQTYSDRLVVFADSR